MSHAQGCPLELRATVISTERGSRFTVSRRIRNLAKLLLPPIVAEPIRRALVSRRSGPPEWVYQQAGWPPADATIMGWGAESVVSTQLARWAEFVRGVDGSAPFGWSNEGANAAGQDYAVHNTVISFGYVLARAAQARSRLSMLDWGGGIGQYYLYAKALLPDVLLDYHCRDLPLLTAGGRQVLPEAQFHETDEEALTRTYDLVMASSSLQYSKDWRGTLAKLASVTGAYLYVTRQPFVAGAPSFVVMQRPHRHGYLTEYPGWFLNRGEFLTEARALGLTLLREFLIDERPLVPGAPEQADYRGFLFAAPNRGAA